MKKTILLLFLLPLMAAAQTDSCGLRISLLTCAPGEALYSSFGHTAIRVQSSDGDDLVFNYGTFEFGPGFYTKFIRGKLNYFLNVEEYPYFEYTYRYESRSIREQELILSCTEKNRLYEALLINAREENKYYLYDFLFDNCTTRAGDIIAANTDTPVVFHNILPPEVPSFRELIHSYLHTGGQYWSKLGIDILLGAKLDREVTNKEAMFLPEYLLKGFDNATAGGKPLAAPAKTILDLPSPLSSKAGFRPIVAFSILLLVVLLLSFVKNSGVQRALRIFDQVYFLLLGLSGILLLFMWFGTDHRVTVNNYNLLWALPTHTVAAFFLHGGRKWVRKYMKFTGLLSIVLLASWFFLPQNMNEALIPVVLLVIVRSFRYVQQKRY